MHYYPDPNPYPNPQPLLLPLLHSYTVGADGRYGALSYHAHVIKSMYAYQFLQWFAYFARDQFFVFTIEDFDKNPSMDI